MHQVSKSISPEGNITRESKPVVPRWLALALLFVALIVATGVRVRLLDLPLERDEGEYAYSGQLLLDGIPPYKIASNMKLPGVYISYAGIMAVFGQTARGIHLGLLVLNLATAAVLFPVARKFMDFTGAVLAAAVYAIMTLSPAYSGLAAHATNFVMLPALIGIWMLLRMKERERTIEYFLCGMFFGIAFVMKQPGACFGLFGGLVLLWGNFTKKTSVTKTLLKLGIYSLGCLLPFLGICLWLKAAGVFPEFWFWTFTYAREYVGLTSLQQGAVYFNFNFGNILKAAPFLWGFFALGLGVLIFLPNPIMHRRFLMGFSVFSFLATCFGLYFRSHYFILWLPSVVCMIGFGVNWAGIRLATKGCSPMLCCFPFVLAIVSCVQCLFLDRAIYFSLEPSEATRAMYSINPFPESIEIANYIRENTKSDQHIAVIGSEPEIYFLSHRKSSATQMYVYPLMEAQPFAVKMQEDMIHEIEQNPPEILVFVCNPLSWLGGADSSQLLLEWVDKYANEHMKLVGLVQTIPSTEAGIVVVKKIETVWGAEAATTPLKSQYHISVFKRQ